MSIKEHEVKEVIDKLYSGITLKRAFDDNVTRMRYFYEFIAENDAYYQAYMRAQQAKAEVLADEIIEISDTEPDPNRARVMVDSRKWYASKIRPDKYGDRIDLNVTQSIDIAAAIKSAKDRICYSAATQIPSIPTQPIDITSENDSVQTGYKPVDIVKEDSSEDIFS